MSQLWPWHLLQLWQLILYYVTFMTISRRQSRHFWAKNAGMGNTPRVPCWRRIPAAWSPRSVNDMDLWFLGSAHCVPNDELCLQWMCMACQWIKLVPTVGAFEAQWYGQPFQTVGFPSSRTSSRTSTHAVSRLWLQLQLELAATFLQWPNRFQLLGNWR